MATVNRPRLLVIGGSGFIGHHLIALAKKKKWDVTSLSMNMPVITRSIDGVDYLLCDINHYQSVTRALTDEFDYVANLGGYIDHKALGSGGRNTFNTHFLGLLNLVDVLSSKNLKRFVHVGSSDEYGNGDAPQREDQREAPISAYSFGKTAGTHLLQTLHRTEQFPAVVLRPFLAYGPRQNLDRFLPQIILGCIQKREFPVSSGEQLRDFCYVDDVVQGIMAALTKNDIEGKIFNIASGAPISIRTVVEMVTRLAGGGEPVFGSIPYRPGESMTLYADISQARRQLDWQPVVTLEQGLSQTIAWYRESTYSNG